MTGPIACLSDVPVGYGTPQIQHLLASLSAHYRSTERALVCEPDSSAFPQVHAQYPEFAFNRVTRSGERQQFWYMDGGAGEAHFGDAVRRWLRAHRPGLLVLTGFNCLRYFDEKAFDGGRRPFVIYCALEFLTRREMDAASVRRHDRAAQFVDVALFSEAHRQVHYNREFDLGGVRQAMLYNAPPLDAFETTGSRRRNGRVLFQSASVQWGLTYPEYLLDPRRPAIPFDVYGLLYPGASQVLDAPDVPQAFGVTYRGSVSNRDLAALRRSYSYAFVAWNPKTFNTLYACPNKLFEAIASGVPPIAAPHPQCEEIIRRYDCGILMRDWSHDAFHAALDQAMRIRNTARYDELVKNCLRAHRSELNWERQFEKLAALLPAATPTDGRAPARVVCVFPGLADHDDPEWRDALRVAEAIAGTGTRLTLMVNRLLREPLPAGILADPSLWAAASNPEVRLSDGPAPVGLLAEELARAFARKPARRDDVLAFRAGEPAATEEFLRFLAGAEATGVRWTLVAGEPLPEALSHAVADLVSQDRLEVRTLDEFVRELARARARTRESAA